MHTPVTKRAAWPRKQRVDGTRLVPSRRNETYGKHDALSSTVRVSRLLVSAPRLLLKGVSLCFSHHATSRAPPRRVWRVRIHARRDRRSLRVPLVKACSMASSSSQRGEARAPPPPHHLADFYKLVDKVAIAGQLGRDGRLVELSAQAAAQAEAISRRQPRCCEPAVRRERGAQQPCFKGERRGK